MPATLQGEYRNGNFLYPYARALMLAKDRGPHSDGLGWAAGSTQFRIMFLNAGIGSAYNFAAEALGGHAGVAVSGYAYNPVFKDPDNDAFVHANGRAYGVKFCGEDASGNLGEGRFAGSIVTSLAQIPVGHRSFQPFYMTTLNTPPYNPTNMPYFGGTANTAVVTGCAITYNGVADASDVTVYTVPSGAIVSAFVLYRMGPGPTFNSDGSVASWPSAPAGTAFASTYAMDQNSLLVAYFDSATGLPVNGNGGDITVVWDNGANKIFKI